MAARHGPRIATLQRLVLLCVLAFAALGWLARADAPLRRAAVLMAAPVGPAGVVILILRGLAATRGTCAGPAGGARVE